MSAQSKKRWFLGLIFFLIIGLGGYSFSFFQFHFNKNIQTVYPIIAKTESRENNIKLAFVGDIMLDRGVEYFVNKSFGGDYHELFVEVEDRLRNYDFLFGNLEGPVSDKGIDGGSLYSFRMDPAVLPVLKRVGFDGFSIDNNHILNYGPEALADTKIRLKNNNLIIGGEDFELGGIRMMILTFNEFANLDLEKMRDQISLAKTVNDLVIVYFHFGEEYQTEPNEYQKMVSKTAVDAGAGLIIGSHPHVIQNLEQYKNVWIVYSLGNFIFDQYFSPETMEGGLLEVEVNPNTKLIEKVSLRKTFLNKMFQLESIQ